MSRSVARHWTSGEPNDDGAEDCVEMHASGGWNDMSCTVSNAAICERPPPGNTP